MEKLPLLLLDSLAATVWRRRRRRRGAAASSWLRLERCRQTNALYDLAVRLMSAVMQHHGGEDGPAAAALLQRSASSAKPALTFAGSVTTLVRTEGGQAAKKNADVDAVSAAATAAAQSAATAQKTEKQLATLT